jgi:hypothetical protein
LSGVLPFKHLSTTPNGLPRGSFLKASQLEKELVSHGL